MKITKLFSLIIILFQITFAHKALLLIEDNGDGTIYIEAGISTGGSAAGNMIYITEISSGKLLWEGKVPKEGNFDIEMPLVPYTVTLDMGKGHKVTKRGPYITMKTNPESQVEYKSKKISEFLGTVAISIKPLEGVVKKLLSGTKIEILNPLKNRSLSEIEQLFIEESDKMRKFALNIDAVISMRSVLEDDKLYNYLRNYNIRLIEIDCMNPLNPKKAGVGLIGGSNNYFSFFNFANLVKILEIISDDLVKLFPKNKETIKSNLDLLKKEIFKNKILVEDWFLSIDNLNVITLGNNFDYQIAESGLINIFKIPQRRSERTDELYSALKSEIIQNKCRVLLTPYEIADNNLKTLLKELNVKVVILNSGLNKYENGTLISAIMDNYKKIYEALK